MNTNIIKIMLVIICLLSSSMFSMAFQNTATKNLTSNIDLYTYSIEFPTDFNLDAYCGGFEPWTEIYSLHINSDGEGYYHILYPEDRATGTFTLISQFDLTSQELNLLWDEITNNDFFSLDPLYEQNDVYAYGGTFANLTITGNQITKTVHSININIDAFDNIVKTINTLTPEGDDLIYDALNNHVPFIPDKPSGKINGSNKEEYEYQSSSYDADGDTLYFMFDWGDGTTSDWVGPYESSEEVRLTHEWEDRGSYDIKVKAIDDPNNDGDLSDGEETEWSEPLAVSMPKNRFNNILVLMSYLKDFFKDYFKLPQKETNDDIAQFSILSTQTTDDGYDPNSGTRAKYKDCEITIEWHITLYGEWVDKHIFDEELADAMDEIMADIEGKWNRDQWDKDGDGTPDGYEPWYVPCESDCEEQEPGCKVKFLVFLTAEIYVDDKEIPKGGEANNNQKQGQHYIHFNGPDKPRGAHVNAWGPDKKLPKPNNGMETTGELNAEDVDGVPAHEAGHLAGLEDEYVKITIPTPFGAPIVILVQLSNSIMAHPDNWPTQEDINEIVENSGIECPCDCCPEDNDTEEPENQITEPSEGEPVSSVVTVKGIASDYGSGVASLNYNLTWDGGTFEGEEYPIDPPMNDVSYTLGPLNIGSIIEPGDWITITTYATDAAGNTGEDSVTVTLIEDQDTIPPVTTKTVGQPNDDGGYLIWPETPILLEATDEGGSGVDYIYYEIAWDIDEDGVYDELFTETVYEESTEFLMLEYGILHGLIELRWYAVDHAENIEDMHYQQHQVMN